MGALVFRHNRRNIRHEECLYDPSYSNIISRLSMPDEFVISGTKGKAELKVGRKTLYKMDRDAGGLWVRLENRVEDWRAAVLEWVT